MRIYLVNDCSHWPELGYWHSGCRAIIDSLKARIAAAGHEVVHVCPRPLGPERDKLDECDWVIVNGEGTMRDEALDHEPGRIRRLREGMELALDMGKRVYLVNSVWCRMDDKAWKPVLERLSGISAREPDSQLALMKASGRVDVEVHPDEAYFHPVEERELHPKGWTFFGDIYSWNMREAEQREIRDRIAPAAEASLSRMPWVSVVNALRGGRVYVTGQHHGVYAACKARCPFVAGKVNTHKVTSLFEWADVDIPLFRTAEECVKQVRTVEDRREEFERLFNFLEEQSPWSIPVS